MLPGDVILESPTDRYGRAVATFGASPYCHARLVVDYDGRTVEASGKGVVWEPDLYEGDLHVTAPLTAEQRREIVLAAEPLIGRPYSRGGLLALGLEGFGLGPAWLTRELDDPKRFTCAHLVAHVWKAVGFDPFGRPAQSITPGDLADKALRDGWAAYEIS